MSPGKKRIPRNLGRIEFIACSDVIDSLRRQGFDNKKIHAALTANGKVTMSYSTLCYHLARFLKMKSDTLTSNVASPLVPGCFQPAPVKGRSFKVNKTPSPGEMI